MSFLIKKKGFFYLFFCVCCAVCFAQENQIKTPFSVRSLSWNNLSSHFAYTEDNHVFIRDAESFSLLKVINEKNVSALLFSSEGNLKNDVLLTLTDKGNFCVWDFYSQEEISEPQTSIQNKTNLDITCASFSNNSDYIALADTNNSINLFFKLRYTHQTIKKTIQAHSEEIFGLTFSSNNKYLISSSIENKAKIWSLKDNNLLAEIPFYSDLKVPCIFSSNSKYVLSPTSKNSFTIFNLEGESLKEIKTQSNIRQISALPLTDLVAVLNDENVIEIYFLKDYSYLGYIPPYNTTDITCFAFNSDSNYVLVGHQDGTIYKLSVKETFLKPTEEPPALRVITSQEAGDNSSKGRLSIIPNYKPFNSMLYSLGASVNSYPFTYSCNASTEFHYGKLLSPLFFGFGLGSSFSFPVKDFPYSYSVNGKKTNPPYLLGISCYVPFGILLKPWDSQIFINSEIKVGCKAYSLLMSTPQGLLPGSFNIGLYCASSVGVLFKNFGFDFMVEYDTISGFYPSLFISYQQKLKNKRGLL